MKRRVFLIGSLLLLLGLGGGELREQAQTGAKPLRVLFVGNSLTYSNHLPAILEAMAREAGERPVVYRDISFPDFSLEDHWNQGDARKSIARDGWDVVIMQQGPSALPESRDLLIEYVKRFAGEIRRSGAKPGLYMVWPAKARSFDFDRVSESYRLAAQEVNGLLFPAGDAWRIAWRRDPTLPLYSGDNFHPSEAGSYLAAAVMFEQLLGRPAKGLPHRLTLHIAEGGKIKIPRRQVEILHAAATAANQMAGLPVP
ncbi:MAG: SGNH/GDSL hydrolase family protein [Blastocatellia bacterium]|nr:SGNH/GDSL hydrolase family protein [Blastocatellia bacterium]